MRTVAQYIADVCLEVQRGEDLLIICDYSHLHMGGDFAESLSCPLVAIPPLHHNGEEPPPQVSHLLQGFDAVLALTSLSLGPTDARKDACAKGTRFVSLAGITDASLETILKTDYALLEKRASLLVPLFESGTHIEVQTGRDSIRMSIVGRHPLPLTGRVRNKGEFGTLPEGEILISPVETSGYGSFWVDVGMVGIGFLEEPIEFHVHEGMVTAVEGAPQCLEEILNSHEGSRQIAECAVGINPAASTHTLFEAKKMEGTCHISLGDNHTIGGIHRCGIHMDGIIRSPTVLIDDIVVVEEGNLVIQ
ncbi:MAG: aminopeptidase [Theionarchaea archaeon]|nr:aminopeptidase [Theionarchaea archaeon]